MAKILIVDDDITLRDMYGERLKAEGYEIDVAANGEEAIRKVQGGSKPDLILLDIMMPKVNGFATLDMLKSTPEYKNIPVILLTALIQDENKVRGLDSGAVDYIIKSETMPGDVIKKVKDVLGKSQGATPTPEAKPEGQAPAQNPPEQPQPPAEAPKE